MKLKRLTVSTAFSLAWAILTSGIGAAPVLASTANKPQSIYTIRKVTRVGDPSRLVRFDDDFVYFIIDPPNAVYAEARSINDAGDVVGYYRSSERSTVSGFLLRNGNYTRIAIQGAVNVFPLRINDKGVIVGASTSIDGRYHGLSLKDGHIVTIDYPGAANTIVTGINDNGEIVGYAFDTPEDVKSFIGKVDDGRLTLLTSGNYVWDINDRDELVGHTDCAVADPIDKDLTPTEGLIVSDPSAYMVEFGFDCKTYGVNNLGDVVGIWPGNIDASDSVLSGTGGFLMRNGSVFVFKVPGAVAPIGSQPYGINDADRIVGAFEEQCEDSRGNAVHAFVAVPKSGKFSHPLWKLCWTITPRSASELFPKVRK